MYIGYQTHPGLFTKSSGRIGHFAVGDRDRGLDCDVAKFVEVAQIEDNK